MSGKSRKSEQFFMDDEKRIQDSARRGGRIQEGHERTRDPLLPLNLDRNGEGSWKGRIISAGIAVLLALSAFCFLPSNFPGAPAPTNVQPRPTGVVVDAPAITIAGTAATTTATPTSAAHEAQIQWNFGAVSGTYSSCAVQLKTSFDGTNWLTLGSAASVTVTSNTLNAWTVIEQLGTTSVTTSSVSSSAALGFGQLTEFSFSCSSYGTSAPVSISVIYR
jgi:hypothetical protein